MGREERWVGGWPGKAENRRRREREKTRVLLWSSVWRPLVEVPPPGSLYGGCIDRHAPPPQPPAVAMETSHTEGAAERVGGGGGDEGVG